MERHVFFVSDRTGITAETLGYSLLAQFRDIQFKKHTLRFIDTPDKARAVAAEVNRTSAATGIRSIVFSTLIETEIRELVAKTESVFFDFVDTFIHPLEAELQQHSSHTMGLAYGIVDSSKYTLRMDAVNFAQATDDGQASHNYEHADVIILGVSRSGKTPTCLYLALKFGVYPANYPLTEEDLGDLRLPAALAPYRKKLFGLSIDPKRLQQIRNERKPDSQYASLRQCQYEARQVEALYRHENIPTMAATAVSVEEIATTILETMQLQWRLG